MSPSSRYDLHAEQRPSRHPCIRWMPFRNAASRIFSSSPTSISMLTGSKLMRCMSATDASLGFRWASWNPVGGAGEVTTPPTGGGGLDGLHGSGPTAGSAGQRVGAIRRDVGLALLVAHLVEQHVRAVEHAAADVVEGPHLLRIEVKMRLRDQRLTVVADVAEIGDDVGQVLAVGSVSHSRNPVSRPMFGVGLPS